MTVIMTVTMTMTTVLLIHMHLSEERERFADVLRSAVNLDCRQHPLHALDIILQSVCCQLGCQCYI